MGAWGERKGNAACSPRAVSREEIRGLGRLIYGPQIPVALRCCLRCLSLFARHLPVSLPAHPLRPVDCAMLTRVPAGTPAAARRHHHLPHEDYSHSKASLWLHDCITLPFALLQIVGVLLPASFQLSLLRSHGDRGKRSSSLCFRLGDPRCLGRHPAPFLFCAR